MKRLVLLQAAAALALGTPAFAADANESYAQHLVDKLAKAHPDVAVLAIHATPEGAANSIIVASNIGRIGKVSDADDLRVITTQKANFEVNKAGDRYEVELPLYDKSKRAIGAVGVVFPYRAGADTAGLQRKATAIRDYMSRRIYASKQLTGAYRWPGGDATTPADSYGQQLLDQLFDAHPEVSGMMIHVTPPGRPDTENVVLASTSGRIGKIADEDDLAVARGGERLELHGADRRFEDLMQLHDAKHNVIGALGITYVHVKDKAPYRVRAHKVLAAFEARTPSAAELFQAPR